VAITGLVALLIAVVEVEQPRVPASVLALTGVMLVAWIGQVWHGHPAWLPLLSGSALALEASHYSGAGIPAVCGVVFTALYLAAYPPRWGFPAAAAMIVTFVTLDRIQSPAEPIAVSLLSTIGLSSAYGVSLAFRRLQREQERTRMALEELRAAREGQLEAARAEERARLAREIHDVLAHTLSALSVQVEGAKLMAERHPGEPRTIESLERAHRLTQEGLEEVRRAVSTLRGDSLPGPELLPALARRFEEDSGVRCSLSVEGVPVHLGPEASLAIYRTAQEALTNVRKHSDATAVSVWLHYADGGAELVVEDRGAARPSTAPGGYGLLGIRERAELLGGSLEAGPLDGTESGFRVRLLVPA
jgi:signal transduction histidine kinase